MPELPRRCENGRQSTEAVAASAARARPTDHGAADRLRRLCVAAGRPAASDDETDVTLCVSGSPSVGSSPAVQLLRADHVSTRAQKRPCADSAHARSLLAQRGRAAAPWASMGSSSPDIRRSHSSLHSLSQKKALIRRLNIGKRQKRSVPLLTSTARILGTGKSCSRRCLSTSANRITQRGRQWKWRRNAWPTGTGHRTPNGDG